MRKKHTGAASPVLHCGPCQRRRSDAARSARRADGHRLWYARHASMENAPGWREPAGMSQSGVSETSRNAAPDQRIRCGGVSGVVASPVSSS